MGELLSEVESGNIKHLFVFNNCGVKNRFDAVGKENCLSVKLVPMDIQQQMERFEQGYPCRMLIRPATIGDGIRKLGDDESCAFTRGYQNALCEKSVCKFVPASGAASRMFRELTSLHNSLSMDGAISDQNHKETLEKFVVSLHKLPFSEILSRKLDGELDEFLSEQRFRDVLDTLFEDLGYAAVPKGLVPFHRYPSETRTAFCEHFREALSYICQDNKASIHFTVPPEFEKRFAAEERKATRLFSSRGVLFDVTYSVQDPKTDTVAVTENGSLITDSSGRMLKRPAGHGALLENLNALTCDCVFIKNIDNVVKEEFLADTERWKKILGGLLVYLQSRIFHYLRNILSSGVTQAIEREITSFCRRELFTDISNNLRGISESAKRELLIRILDRPIRVCGVVGNRGEPGGGPFWVEKKGAESLQIVEKAEVDMDSESQRAVWEGSTHFNPVDIVCGLKNFRGEKFDLHRFVDSEAGIITEKSFEGKKIRVLELPGLWNGSMSGWTTVFVEVPLSTFNPVKTVWDLLKKPHQITRTAN